MSKEVLSHAIIDKLGMELHQYTWKSCVATVAEGDGWATLYDITSGEQGKGHATELLKLLKHVYRNVSFGGTVALNPAMEHLYKKLKIKEYV